MKPSRKAITNLYRTIVICLLILGAIPLVIMTINNIAAEAPYKLKFHVYTPYGKPFKVVDYETTGTIWITDQNCVWNRKTLIGAPLIAYDAPDGWYVEVEYVN